MPLTIWKFVLDVDDEQTIEVPVGATALSVQVQAGRPCLWALVDPDAEKTPRRIAIRGTGHDCSGLERAAHLGTFQLVGGQFIGHVFERPPEGG